MKKILLGLALLSLTSSCADDMFKRENEPEEDGVPVEVTLSLGIAAEQSATPDFIVPRSGTRSVDDPDFDAETVIYNVWVAQFSGTSDDAVLIGHPTYLDDFQHYKNVQLIASSKPNTLVFIANTFKPEGVIPQGSTLGDLKGHIKNISEQSDLFGLAGNKIDGKSFPDNGEYHIMLNGTTEVSLSNNSETVSCDLKRNVARIDFNLKVKDDVDITVDNVKLCSVPAKSYFVTCDLPDIFPSSFTTVNFDAPAMRVDEADKSVTYSFYTSVNQRGTTPGNTSESAKGQFAPESSTHILVTAHYTEEGIEIPIYYTFYLGANLLDDFNLRPNHKYSYKVAINARGDASTDTRVTDWGTVDFTDNQLERSNCYILNPAPVTGYDRKFRIPVDRVDTFWGNNGYENNPSYTLAEGMKPWRMEIIWADFDYTAEGVALSKDKGAGSRDYFEVSVPRNVSGNMVVGLKLDAADSPVLWSWHLWITDYNPDIVERISPQAGRYVYAVTGGNVHRYSGNSWERGKHNRFIMDRNVGALSSGFVNPGEKGVLYYQFGRKDPVPGPKTTLYGPNNPRFETKKYTSTGADNYENVIYSINHPLIFITNSSGNWSNGTKYFDDKYVWNDPLLQQDSSTDGALSKSIFDPSPLGWCLPQNDVAEDFRENGAVHPTTNCNVKAGTPILRGFTPFGDPAAQGLRYWPYPESGDITVTDEIYFPSVGVLSSSSGGLTSSDIYLWSCSRPAGSGAKSGNAILHARINSLNTTSARSSCAYGYPVRCVQHRRYK